MPLEDRMYMQDPLYGPRKSVTVVMLITLVVCYAIQSIEESYHGAGAFFIARYLTLNQGCLLGGYVWQLLTFQFLHGGFWHILFNGLALYSFGKGLEQVLSTRHWLQIYFGGGIVGGLFHILGNLVFPYNFPAPVVGASAGVFAVIAVYCFLNPAQGISI